MNDIKNKYDVVIDKNTFYFFDQEFEEYLD